VPEDFLPFLDKLDPGRRFHGYLPEGPVELSGGRTSWWNHESPEGPGRQLAPVGAWLDGLPFPAGRTVLGGWSQGASLAYSLAFAAGRPRPVALLALGGWLPDEPPLDLSPPLPRVLIGHGTADESVPVAAARSARDRLLAAGAEVVYRETPVAHEIGAEVVPSLQAFLAEAAARIVS
jgi:phospholipase/carboxylesterase